MMKFRAGLFPFLILAWIPSATATMYWQPSPHQHGSMQHDRMAAKHFVLHGGDGASVRFLHSDLKEKTLKLEHGQLSFKPTGKNNYHALIASRNHDNIHETAIRYLFLHGKPTGHSPSELTSINKSALEIVPSPLPREHWHYQGNQPARFQIRFEGEPLAGHVMSILTSNGTEVQATSDAQGMIQVTVPNDFTAIKPGRMHNPPAEWQFTVQHVQNGELYRTILTAPYYVDARHWQSLSWGMTTTGGGMLLGVIMLVRRQRRKQASDIKRGRR